MSQVFRRMLVFVYGTLKRQEPNHHWLTDSNNGVATFVDIGRTVTTYPLIIASKYNIPFLLDAPGKGHRVRGELYEIDEQMLKQLDVLEEYPTLYTRREESVEDSKGQLLKALTYFLSNYRPELLEKAMWEEYSAKGPHNLPYRERYLRDKNFDHRPQVKLNYQPPAT